MVGCVPATGSIEKTLTILYIYMSISYIIYPSEKRRRAGNTLSGWQVQDVQHLPLQLEEHKCREPLREKKTNI